MKKESLFSQSPAVRCYLNTRGQKRSLSNENAVFYCWSQLSLLLTDPALFLLQCMKASVCVCVIESYTTALTTIFHSMFCKSINVQTHSKCVYTQFAISIGNTINSFYYASMYTLFLSLLYLFCCCYSCFCNTIYYLCCHFFKQKLFMFRKIQGTHKQFKRIWNLLTALGFVWNCYQKPL